MTSSPADVDAPKARPFSSTFFQNRACEYFPCHEGVALDDFNCLFCYCPLYALGPTCGGAFRYSKSGVKICTDCTLLHIGDTGAGIVKQRFSELRELAKPRFDSETTGDGEVRF